MQKRQNALVRRVGDGIMVPFGQGDLFRRSKGNSGRSSSRDEKHVNR